VTRIDTSVGGGGAVQVKVVLPVIPLRLALIKLVPADTHLTGCGSAFGEIVAIAVVCEVQTVGERVISLELPSE
jgi:hypothetical protein